MSNIGYFKVGTSWKKASEIMEYTFEDSKSYEIQNKGPLPLLVYDGKEFPSGTKMGFIVFPYEVAVYVCKEGEDLYVRSLSSKAGFNISEL